MLKQTFALALITLCVTQAAPAAETRAGLVVYGATAGGVVASIAAADAGLDVVLLEPGQHVGGLVAGGLTRTDHGNKSVIGGMSREFFERVGRHYGEDVTWYFEPSAAEGVFLEWLDEADVDVRYGERVDTVAVTDQRVERIEMESGHVYMAPVFIDASYEGDVMARAGISYTVGREGRDVYGESLAGRREYSPKHQFQKPLSPYDDDGELLSFIYGGDPGVAGQGDQKVQAYNFRLCLTQNPDNRKPFPEPPDYDADDYELLRRHLQANPDLEMNELMTLHITKNGKTDTNNNGPFSTDYIGGSWAYPDADYEKRREIFEEHKHYTQGFLYFLANDPSVPDELQAEVNTWGLARDEFTGTNNWPHQLYIREARRMIGAYVMKQKDLQTERTKPDAIGMGSYNSDSHNVQRIPVESSPVWGDEPGVLNEGDMQVPVRPYEIAYRALTPKAEECTNLLVASCVSASHVAYSSIRMEPQYMIMGQAAGLAAAQVAEGASSVQTIDIADLQQSLSADEAVLSYDDMIGEFVRLKDLDGIVIDNEHADHSEGWRRSTAIEPYVGLDYDHVLADDPRPKSIRYTPNLPEAGRYEIRMSYSPHANRASNAQVRIQTADGVVTRTVNQREPVDNDDPFISLGTFELPAGTNHFVEITDTDADGYVVADAVQWLKR